MDRAELSLPPHLARPLILILKHFHPFIPLQMVVMSGGSILASRWHHRKSTDIDLFMPVEIMKQVLEQDDEALIKAVRSVPGAREINVSRIDEVAAMVDGTPFSLTDSPFIRLGRQDTERICGTPVQAASAQEAFMGKIAGRLAHFSLTVRPPPVRDLYDIVVGAQLAPSALQDVFSQLDRNVSESIAEYLDAQPLDWHATDTKTLEEASWSLSLERLPQRMSRVFLSRQVEDMPVPIPKQGGDGAGSLSP